MTRGIHAFDHATAPFCYTWRRSCERQTDTESDAKARYTLPVSTGRVHGPCPRPWPPPVNTGVQNDARVDGPRPCSRAVDIGVILEVAVDTARKHGPWTWVVCIPSLTSFL